MKIIVKIDSIEVAVEDIPNEWLAKQVKDIVTHMIDYVVTARLQLGDNTTLEDKT